LTNPPLEFEFPPSIIIAPPPVEPSPPSKRIWPLSEADDIPVDTIIAPVFDAALPVEKDIEPLSPRTELLETIDVEPLFPDELEPPLMERVPPAPPLLSPAFNEREPPTSDAEDVVPAIIEMSPPLPVSPEPDSIEMGPPFPVVACPLPTTIAPESAPLLVPVAISTSPLPPTFPEAAEEMETSPLVVSADIPLAKESRPPVIADKASVPPAVNKMSPPTPSEALKPTPKLMSPDAAPLRAEPV